MAYVEDRANTRANLAHLTALLDEAKRVYAAAESAGVRVEIGHYLRLREGHSCIERLTAALLSEGSAQ